MRIRFSFAAVASVVALLIAGCGSSTKSTTPTASYSPAAQSNTATSTTSAATSGSTAAGGGVVVMTKHNSKLGTILAAGPKRLTVYLFEGDTGPSSSCSGACAQAWPPVTTTTPPTASGGAMAANLGTITRSDGTKQVTYKGHPLYFFATDKDDGDAYGQGVNGFGASWYVLKPSGAKLDQS